MVLLSINNFTNVILENPKIESNRNLRSKLSEDSNGFSLHFRANIGASVGVNNRGSSLVLPWYHTQVVWYTYLRPDIEDIEDEWNIISGKRIKKGRRLRWCLLASTGLFLYFAYYFANVIGPTERKSEIYLSGFHLKHSNILGFDNYYY